MSTSFNNLYIVWVIGMKDIRDALKNKYALPNIIVMLGMVVFFYWFGSLRPFDPDVSVVAYDESSTNQKLVQTMLGDGAVYSFQEADSLQDMQTRMAHKNLGLVLPANFDQVRAAGGPLTLQGYVFWADRLKAADLEAKYSQAFSEILGLPVRVVIGVNIVIPHANVFGMHATVAEQLVLFIFGTALFLIPHLMLEEKQTKTMEALLVSPASAGQIVMGKALAGFFYILLIGGLSIALNWVYIVHWGVALAAFLGYTLLAIGLALAIGSFVTSTRQLSIWTLVLILFLVIPPLFYMESNLRAGLRDILTWFPTSALTSLLRFSYSTGITPALVWPNLAVALASIGLSFGLVIWKVRRSDR